MKTLAGYRELLTVALLLGPARSAAATSAAAPGPEDEIATALADTGRYLDPPTGGQPEGELDAAIDAGACGASISGSGPTIFAIATDEVTAHRVGAAMTDAFGDIDVTSHVAKVANDGAKPSGRTL